MGRADLPLLNACLNGLCTLLLLVGYVAIRLRRVRLHKICMLAALGVSAVFLASYLYYHFVIQGRTPFTGPPAVHALYLAILISHSVLAAVSTPLALVTAYFGVRDRLDRHVKIARWTLPIWLYVSVTGVVVYLMLYQLYPPNPAPATMSGE
jgi:uncharacterized membrane protein YozB (DUF420 family)